MNTFWLIHDGDGIEKATECVSVLERGGKCSVMSSHVTDVFATYTIICDADKATLVGFMERSGVSFRFTTAEGIAEFNQGFAKRLFDVAAKAFIKEIKIKHW